MLTKEQRAELRNHERWIDLSSGRIPAIGSLLDDLDETEREHEPPLHFTEDRRHLKCGASPSAADAQWTTLRKEITCPACLAMIIDEMERAHAEELHRLRLELAAQQEEARALRAQQHIDAGRVRVPRDLPTFPEWDAEIERANRAAGLLDALPQHQIHGPDRDAPARVLEALVGGAPVGPRVTP